MKIETLSNWNFPDTSHKWSGYDQVTIPDATSANIRILVEKINELVETVNDLQLKLNIIKNEDEDEI